MRMTQKVNQYWLELRIHLHSCILNNMLIRIEEVLMIKRRRNQDHQLWKLHKLRFNLITNTEFQEKAQWILRKDLIIVLKLQDKTSTLMNQIGFMKESKIINWVWQWTAIWKMNHRPKVHSITLKSHLHPKHDITIFNNLNQFNLQRIKHKHYLTWVKPIALIQPKWTLIHQLDLEQAEINRVPQGL